MSAGKPDTPSQEIKWNFTPYDLVSWNTATPRILFVAAEPNGDNPNNGIFDMGDWFRTANPSNRYHKNEQFFRRCCIMLQGILINKKPEEIFGNFRFMDLKATQGSAKSSEKALVDYVTKHKSEVLQYFISEDKKFGLAPDIVIVLGGHAHTVFSHILKPMLISHKAIQLKYVYMPHPSAQISYSALEQSSLEITNKLAMLTDPPYKWFYGKSNCKWSCYGTTV